MPQSGGKINEPLPAGRLYASFSTMIDVDSLRSFAAFEKANMCGVAPWAFSASRFHPTSPV